MDIPEYALDNVQRKYFRDVVKFDESLSKADRNVVEKEACLFLDLDKIIAVKKVFPSKSVKECFDFLRDRNNWCGPLGKLSMFLYQKNNEYIKARFFEYFNEEDFANYYPTPATKDFLSDLCGFKWTNVGEETYGVYEQNDLIVRSGQYAVRVESNLTEEFLVYASSPEDAIDRYHEMTTTGYPILNKTLDIKAPKEVTVADVCHCSGKVRLTDRQ